jgi:glycosyltransferase involved in cell wall biosynthesis
MKASVVIITRNRKNELRNAVASALRQTGDVEIIVIDDGSTDGTAKMVRGEFPQVRLERSELSRGLVEQRNRGAALALGDIIFSIDDDAEFSAPSIIEDTLALFSEPRIGAVAIPSVEPHKGGLARQVAPDAENVWITDSFIGTAHALRRDLFLKLGGYRGYLIHQGEEVDFCLRLMNEGYLVRVGTSAPIIHYESPLRDTRRIDYYGRRNDILFVWLNVPWRLFPLHFIGATVNAVRTSFTRNQSSMLAGICAGYFDCIRFWRERRPVRLEVYRTARRLRKAGCLRFDEIAAGLYKSSQPQLGVPAERAVGSKSEVQNLRGHLPNGPI